MKELAGKNALLTGASRGLGRYIAQALAAAGVNLALTARESSERDLERVAHDCASLGVRTTTVCGDLTRPDDRERIAALAHDEMGPLQILVNNAGYEHYAAFRSLEASTIRRTVETNLIAALEMTRLILPSMLDAHSGHIVNIASVAGKSPVAYNSVYSATKAGLVFWSSALRDELEGTGVDVSVICPGYVSGDGMHARYGIKPPRIAAEVSPDEVAQAVLCAIQENRQEVLVWRSRMIRPMLALKELAPGFVRAIYRRFGMYDFFRKKAEIEQQMRGSHAQSSG